jgi:hypothetical protein
MVNDITSATQAAAGAGPFRESPAPAAAEGLETVDVSAEPLLTVVGLAGSRLKLKARALPAIKVGLAVGQ